MAAAQSAKTGTAPGVSSVTGVTVHGVIPAGSRLEFLAQGSPERKIAPAGDGGKYTVELLPARYEITLVYSSGKRFVGLAWLIHPQVELNAQPEGGRAPSSGQEFDLLADWRVTNAAGAGIGPSKISVEAELRSGATEKLTVWALSGTGDEEKETEGPLETTPDGRVLFRIRESRLRPDRVMALRVAVAPPTVCRGCAAATRRIIPILEFSSSGHFHAVYPEELVCPAVPSPAKP